eukprot:CAMPEP_0174378850 /NCGR_PEP_ID=MMETSP0811_2-20130205/122316_1 /TAXON_ID=73025 ORGANISM="Eutreptiella gymnastica-like, Strain CCMP1594" /NCGR_SAMPLE_ID=MMETSP0811_2 /ASSEMBLY_ACC=CAM_ASM_000667 /LENGTH=638 /DNA_ID=CAMNT_0015531185 /DNA_START=137 /DNA_END=2053 /DNA_ORIENTATION=-
MVFISYVGYSNGDLWRLYYGTDFMGNVCTRPSPQVPSDVELRRLGTGNWTERQNIWYPIVPDHFYGNDTIAEKARKFLSLGVCVKECPKSNGNAAKPNMLTTYGGNLSQVWPVYYDSKPILHRCIPDLLSDTTVDSVKDVLREVTSIFEGTSMAFSLGQEVVASRHVFAICLGTGVLFCFLLTWLFRYILGLLVYVMLILLEVLIVAGGLLLLQAASTITANPDQYSLYTDYVVAIRVAAGVCFGLAVVYFLLLFFFIKRIRIAIQVLKIASKVMITTPSVILVPLVMLVGVIAATVWCGLTAAYLQSSARLVVEDLAITDPITNNTFVIPASHLSREQDLGTYMQLYNFFGFLWTVGIVNAMSFMTISFVAVMYYFSTVGEDKRAPVGAVFIGLCLTIRYHLGTLAFGALILAVMQFVRAIAMWVQKRLEASGNAPAKWLGRCVQCYLACLQRIVEFANRNAYVVCCIESTGFCRSCCRGVEVVLSNLVDVGASNFIADAVFVFIKLCIVALNTVLAWVLVRNTEFGEGIQVVYVCLVLVAIVTWVVASIFMHIYDAVQDSILLCFCYDKERNNGANRPYYFTAELADILNKYNAPSANSQAVARDGPITGVPQASISNSNVFPGEPGFAAKRLPGA